MKYFFLFLLVFVIVIAIIYMCSPLFRDVVKTSLNISRDVHEYNKKVESYLTMTDEELKELSDEDLSFALSYRLTNKMTDDGEDFLNEQQEEFLALTDFEMEIMNGGLSQFFINSSGKYAPKMEYYLRDVGITDVADLYSNFVKKNNIDLNSFTGETEDYSEYDELIEKYNFDDFDEYFYDMYENGDAGEKVFKFMRDNFEMLK